MTVTLKLAEPLARRVGEKSIVVSVGESATVADVFATVGRQHANFADALASGDDDVPYTIFVNDALVQPAQFAQASVRDGDRVFVMMPTAGGIG